MTSFMEFMKRYPKEFCFGNMLVQKQCQVSHRFIHVILYAMELTSWMQETGLALINQSNVAVQVLYLTSCWPLAFGALASPYYHQIQDIFPCMFNHTYSFKMFFLIADALSVVLMFISKIGNISIWSFTKMVQKCTKRKCLNQHDLDELMMSKLSSFVTSKLF